MGKKKDQGDSQPTPAEVVEAVLDGDITPTDEETIAAIEMTDAERLEIQKDFKEPGGPAAATPTEQRDREIDIFCDRFIGPAVDAVCDRYFGESWRWDQKMANLRVDLRAALKDALCASADARYENEDGGEEVNQ